MKKRKITGLEVLVDVLQEGVERERLRREVALFSAGNRGLAREHDVIESGSSYTDWAGANHVEATADYLTQHSEHGHNRVNPLFYAHMPDTLPAPDKDADEPQSRTALYAEALASVKLSPRQRDIVEAYRNNAEATQEEIAQKLGVTQPFVAQQLARIGKKVESWVVIKTQKQTKG